MPIFEYYCPKCHKIYQFLVRSISTHQVPSCPACKFEGLTRRFSRFAVALSEDSRLEKLANPASLSGLDESDPKSMARWMRKMSREMGDEDLGPEFHEMLDRLEAGEDPEEIERTLGMGTGGPTTDSTLYDG